MSIPGRLYDNTISPATLIATVRLATARRLVPVTARHKFDDGWLVRLDGDGDLELRVTAEGIMSLEWLATLYARQDARASAAYLVEMDDGDSHQGLFMVEELGEQADTDDRRRFRLVLLSDGPVVYNAAP